MAEILTFGGGLVQNSFTFAARRFCQGTQPPYREKQRSIWTNII
jgi:hypothetical protein